MAVNGSRNGAPKLSALYPAAAMPGGEIQVAGSSLGPAGEDLPQVQVGDSPAYIVMARPDRLTARIGENSLSGELRVKHGSHISNGLPLDIAIPIADELNPVSNPAVDDYGNIYVASSGPRGQMVDTSVFKIDLEYTPTPFTSGILNATGVAWGPDQHLYVSSREEGTIYRVAPTGAKTIYAEGMGVATGIVFDHERNLYCGDRSGTIFKIGPDRQIYVFATLEPSIAAYHLTAASDGTLYVSAPTTSSYDSVYCISPDGNVRVYYAGLGRPQGLALDASGNLHVAASLHGRRGVVRITPRGEASIAIAGSGIVGLAFLPGGAMALTTNLAVYYLALSARGQ